MVLFILFFVSFFTNFICSHHLSSSECDTIQPSYISTLSSSSLSNELNSFLIESQINRSSSSPKSSFKSSSLSYSFSSIKFVFLNKYIIFMPFCSYFASSSSIIRFTTILPKSFNRLILMHHTLASLFSVIVRPSFSGSALSHVHPPFRSSPSSYSSCTSSKLPPPFYFPFGDLFSSCHRPRYCSHCSPKSRPRSPPLLLPFFVVIVIFNVVVFFCQSPLFDWHHFVCDLLFAVIFIYFSNVILRHLCQIIFKIKTAKHFLTKFMSNVFGVRQF